MSLIVKAARGVAWTMGSSVGARIVGAIGTLILARFIMPDEYGAVQIAAVLVFTADEFSQFGLFQYVVVKPEAPPSTVFHATFYHLLFGIIAYSFVVSMTPVWAKLLDVPTLGLYLPGMAVAIFFRRLAVPAERVLCRDLRFAAVGLSRALGEFLYTGMSITLAVYGFGGLAIVYGNICQFFLMFMILVIVADRKEWLTPSKIRWNVSKDLFAFGGSIYFGHLAHFASRWWDRLLFAKFFNTEVVGRYQLAYSLADIPATHLGEHIGDVLMPTFARMGRQEGKDTLVGATSMLGVIIFPLAMGLGAVAHSLTHAIFPDPRWQAMSDMLVVLSVLSVVRPLGWVIGSYLIARSLPKVAMIMEILKLIVLVAAVSILSNWGPVFACVGIGIAFCAHAMGSMFAVRKSDGVSMGALFFGAVPPLLATVPMVSGVLGVRYLLRNVVGLELGVITLLAEISIGAIIYIPAALTIARKPSRELITLIKSAIKGAGTGAESGAESGEENAPEDSPENAPEDSPEDGEAKSDDKEGNAP